MEMEPDWEVGGGDSLYLLWALVRDTPVRDCAHLWGPQYKKDVEQVQRRETKMIRVLEHLS